jgi:hypothetical protein
MLLINHFGVQDHEAMQLWESAGYENETEERSRGFAGAPTMPTVVFLALDVRVMYSDGMEVTGNKSGVVMNFTQMGAQGQQLPISRIGMSYEQAEKVMHVLEQALLRKRYMPNVRLLPPGGENAK